ncbi:MAG: glycosyltransferase [Chloroflexota bacterium]|nr:MAG: glycosyltransferase [Chloroflexota bacterium]
MTPLISVLMPARNASAYIAESLTSLVKQTFEDFEVIVVDDESSDGTGQIASDIGDRRIRVTRNDQRRGISGALNRAIEEAQGRLFARLDADDIALPERFAAQVEFLDRSPEIGVVGTAFRKVDRAGRPLDRSHLVNDPTILAWELYFSNQLAHPSVMMRADLVRAVGGYRDEFAIAQDYDLWTRIARRAGIANLPTIMLHLRQHEGQATVQHLSRMQNEADQIRRDYLLSLTMRPIDDDVAAAWCRVARGEVVSGAGRLDAVARLTARAAATYIRQARVSAEHARDIRRRAAQRIFTLANFALRGAPWVMPILVGRAMALNPRVAIDPETYRRGATPGM